MLEHSDASGEPDPASGDPLVPDASQPEGEGRPWVVSPGDALVYVAKQKRHRVFDAATIILILLPVPFITWACIAGSYGSADEDHLGMLVLPLSLAPAMLYSMLRGAFSRTTGAVATLWDVVVVPLAGCIPVGLASVGTYFWPSVHARYMALLDAGARMVWWSSPDGGPVGTIVTSFLLPAGAAMILGIVLWVFVVLTVKAWRDPVAAAKENMYKTETPEQRRDATNSMRVLVLVLQLVLLVPTLAIVGEGQGWRWPVVLFLVVGGIALVRSLMRTQPVDKEARRRAGFYR